MTADDPRVAPTLSLPLKNFSPSPQADFRGLLALADMADEVGIDRVVVVDHVVMGAELDAYDGGVFPTGPAGVWLEPMTVLSVIAGRTARVRLATGIVIAALRRPVVLAKAAATLDVLSGGRLDLGVGVGWQRKEYEAAGLRFADRGSLLDETLEICRLLWRDGPASYASATANLDAVWCEPGPRAGHIPVWIAGRPHGRTISRIIRFGEGWIPWGEHRDDPRAGIVRIRQALEDAGRDPAALQVRASLPIGAADGGLVLGPAMDKVQQLSVGGVTDFQLAIPLPADGDGAAEVAATVVRAFRQAVGRPAPETVSTSGQ